ncbi:transposase [Streptomyces smyrnaeus]|uniref:transposase n=1 Tax=Streptomyces smyrnaeus TaxID=1387713 RepID=UPI0035583C61
MQETNPPDAASRSSRAGAGHPVRWRTAERLCEAIRPEVWGVENVSFPKCGTASAGVIRQHCGALGKRPSSQPPNCSRTGGDESDEWDDGVPARGRNTAAATGPEPLAPPLYRTPDRAHERTTPPLLSQHPVEGASADQPHLQHAASPEHLSGAGCAFS